MKNIFQNLFLSLFSLIVIFIIAEVGFRFYVKHNIIYDIEMHKYATKIKKKSSSKGLSHEHIPNSEADLMNVNIKINSMGFRDNEISVQKDTNEYRILVIGSSITLGWGVPYDSVFTTLLEKKLNNENAQKKYNVVNSGNGNYNSQMELLFFKKIYPQVKPDMVILHYFINDAEIIAPKSSNFLVRKSYLVAYFFVRIKQALHSKVNNYQSIGEYYKSLYQDSSPGFIASQKAILEMKQICNNLNFEFVVLVQPDLHNISQDSDQVKCYQTIKGFLKENDIEFLNLAEAYRENFGNKPFGIWVNKDDSHPDSKGHYVIFEELYKYLTEKLEIN